MFSNNHRLKFIFAVFLVFLSLCAVEAQAWGGPKIEDLVRRGDEAFYERNYEKSRECYSEAVKIKPRAVAPHVMLGRLYYAMARYTQAKREFETALSLHPDAVIRKFLESALNHMNNTAEILRRIEATSDTLANRSALATLHEAAAQRMYQDRAYMALLGAHLRYMLEADPKNSVLRAGIADAFYLSSDPVSAVVLYEELVRLSPRNRPLLKRLADTYISLGRFDQASMSYKKALRESVRTGDREEIDALLKLIRTLPAPFGKVRLLAEDKEDYAGAIAALKRRLDLNGYDLGAMTMMGALYEQVEEDAKAEKLYKTALEIDPEYPYAHFYMGRWLLLKKKKFEEAVDELNLFKEYLEAAGYRPGVTGKTKEMILKDRVQASRYLATIYSEVLNRKNTAIQELQQALVLAPKDAELYYDLGASYAGAKKRMSAIQSFKKVIELKPKSELAKEAENAIDIIRSYGDNGRYTSPW